MMKRSIAFALICSFTISLWAQTFKGRVVDLAGNPIPYAALYLKELKTGFTTDDNGCFQTSLPAGQSTCCSLFTSDAAGEIICGGVVCPRRILKNKHL